VRLACASGYSRPVVESHMATLISRGADRVRYKGLEGAVVQMGMTVMAHNGAVLVRIRQQRLSKRGQKFCQLLGLTHHINDSQS
jgi:IS5 family transposase